MKRRAESDGRTLVDPFHSGTGLDPGRYPRSVPLAKPSPSGHPPPTPGPSVGQSRPGFSGRPPVSARTGSEGPNRVKGTNGTPGPTSRLPPGGNRDGSGKRLGLRPRDSRRVGREHRKVGSGGDHRDWMREYRKIRVEGPSRCMGLSGVNG